LTWWRSGDLVGVAPLRTRRHRVQGLGVTVLEPWGRTRTPMSGWADAIVDPTTHGEVVADLGQWLSDRSVDWDIFEFLHLRQDSPFLAALATGPRRWRVDLTRTLHSLDHVIALPTGTDGWRGQLGAKARHEIRRQERRFADFRDGRVEIVTDPGRAVAVAMSLDSLMAVRWGSREAYFRVDPAYPAFLSDAIHSLFEAGLGWALVAQDDDGVQACLVMAAHPPTAVALMIGVTSTSEYRSMSLGKCLIHRAIDEAVARGCQVISFLTEGAYKRSFWRAEGRPIESGFVARGARGMALAALTWSRRVMPAAISAQLTGHGSERYRP
jgi:hypothetical protein